MATTSWKPSQARGPKGLKGGVGCIAAIIGLSVLLPCIGGVLGIFASVFTGDFEFSTDTNDLDTSAGWRSFVDDIRDEDGTTRVERVRFDDTTASVWVRTSTGEAKETRWRNGIFDSSTTRTTSLPAPATFDLALLTDVLGGVRDQAADDLGVSDPRSVQADVVPSGISVTVIAETGQVQVASYDFSGEPR